MCFAVLFAVHVCWPWVGLFRLQFGPRLRSRREGGAPFLTTGFEPLARATLHLTRIMAFLGDFFCTRYLTISICGFIHIAKLKTTKRLETAKELEDHSRE